MLRYKGLFQSEVSHLNLEYTYTYLIKIKTVLANFDSEKPLTVKKAYFITTEIDLIREEQPPFLNEGNVKFLQIKLDTIRQNT